MICWLGSKRARRRDYSRQAREGQRFAACWCSSHLGQTMSGPGIQSGAQRSRRSLRSGPPPSTPCPKAGHSAQEARPQCERHPCLRSRAIAIWAADLTTAPLNRAFHKVLSMPCIARHSAGWRSITATVERHARTGFRLPAATEELGEGGEGCGHIISRIFSLSTRRIEKTFTSITPLTPLCWLVANRSLPLRQHYALRAAPLSPRRFRRAERAKAL
jgi:hypothetical protein